MTEIDELKTFVLQWLNSNPGVEQLPSKKVDSKQTHLSVWQTRQKRHPIGVELGHAGQVNFWLIRQHVPPFLPPTVEQVRKAWAGAASGWRDDPPNPARKGRDGANSNLKPFEVFNGRPVTRLEVRTVRDAELILKHVTA